MIGVQSIPDDLFAKGNKKILPNSTLWLHCIVESVSSTLTLTWTKNSVPLVIDIIHIRTRKAESAAGSTTLTLIVDNFEAFDSGIYQCIAENEGEILYGTELNLTGTLVIIEHSYKIECFTASISTNGSLKFVSVGVAIHQGFRRNFNGPYLRVPILSGSTVVVDYQVMFSTPPTVTWLLNGRPFQILPNISVCNVCACMVPREE